MLGIGRYGPLGADAPRPDEPARRLPDAADAMTGDAEREAWVVLGEAAGVGPVSFGRLIGVFGSASAVLAAARGRRGAVTLVEAVADADGSASLVPATARAIVQAATEPEAVLGPVRRSGVEILILSDPRYPARLRRIELPPPVLFVRGASSSLDRTQAVAVVGTRRPTLAGRATAARIADAVAGLDATIVSGLALGIDAAAHVAAVDVGTPTVAVIGGGHDRLYPAAHRGLVRRIVDGGGAVISEFSPATIPSRGTFPRRNRIISGLADATVVVEAGARSGALTTAAWALEQGRGLFLVPGRLDDPTVAGSLAFLREAGPEARVVAGIPELLEDLGLLCDATADAGRAGRSRTAAGPARHAGSVLTALPPVERAIAGAVIAGTSSVDELALATGLGPATVLGALTALEVRGLVIETSGRYRAAGPLASGGTRTRVPRATPRAA
jgi:DNA processing protein